MNLTFLNFIKFKNEQMYIFTEKFVKLFFCQCVESKKISRNLSKPDAGGGGDIT